MIKPEEYFKDAIVEAQKGEFVAIRSGFQTIANFDRRMQEGGDFDVAWKYIEEKWKKRK